MCEQVGLGLTCRGVFVGPACWHRGLSSVVRGLARRLLLVRKLGLKAELGEVDAVGLRFEIVQFAHVCLGLGYWTLLLVENDRRFRVLGLDVVDDPRPLTESEQRLRVLAVLRTQLRVIEGAHSLQLAFLLASDVRVSSDLGYGLVQLLAEVLLGSLVTSLSQFGGPWAALLYRNVVQTLLRNQTYARVVSVVEQGHLSLTWDVFRDSEPRKR